MTMQERIQQDLMEAMRNKQEARLSALRMIKTALRNREVEKRKPLDEGECQQVFSMLIKQRREAAEQYRRGGREDLAAKEEQEITILDEFMPAAPTDAEIAAAIDDAVSETGATSPKQMGAVMKAVQAKLAGKRVDGKALSDKVKARLAGPPA